MANRRTRPELRAIAGDRKAGETQRRTERAKTARVDPVDPPSDLAPAAADVWNRVEPLLRSRGMVSDENADVLAAYCVAAAANAAAAAELFADDGSPRVMVESRDRGRIKNPAAQIFRDTAATMKSLGAVLHLDELGLGRDNRDGRDAERLLS